ncbi:MAG: glycoside hydrolase family 30 beta sandwich domain-containing protein [Flavobacterium nitrogenifigens]|uniref:glycoside hydrolase family 30 protein n=1 Tax=Flavobacterium nitrogenifigens TaxID=1617283 RepID=UPI0028073881|nr:glycoside hydrolase family 30 beta sandwich domain-containing protein [Flavobacterium nitrogenifigens]MDQ8013405.1 glycoside hydrolase family 30 beta sandwich domain-containing protein [Flavobacterium nitrogenifigens]
MKFNLKNTIKAFFFMAAVIAQVKCSSSSDPVENPPVNPPVVNPPVVVKNDVDFWLTKGNQSVLLAKQSGTLGFGTTANAYANIEVNATQKYQTIDGFGYTLTGGSVDVINQLNATKRTALLQELFGNGENSIGVSYIRISIGASDLNATPFTYNDLAAGDTDLNLDKFSLEKDKNLIAMLKEILAINPKILILATPWSAPIWMKDVASFKGGKLKTEYYNVYAKYFVKYIQQMKAEGITIDAVTPQNEPLHDGNNPSMYMSATDQASFIKNSLGPAFKTANLNVKIIAYDHNCDNPNYPKAILADTDAFPFVDGSAFHLYAGDISALTNVYNSYPTKNVYFTEQWTSSEGSFDGDLKWHLRNVIIGSMRNYSKNALEWNVANNANFGPHTDGGCTMCKGAITITSSDSFQRNVAYYIIAHASKFVPMGSVRIESNSGGSLQNVAFITPSGSKVLIVENDGSITETFNIKFNGKWVTTSLEAGSVGTYTWK